MTDSMKFGPEWLRNLSSEGTTAGAPKYQLAEHRYGREEMLALFDRTVRAPDALVKIQGLYVEKTQMPMALLSMTEEETRQWNRGINSDAVLRLAGKAPLGLPGGLRGRGGSVDRGRGRTRGSGGFHYTRGLSYDETSEGIKDGALERGGFSRGGRGYDRSQGGERGWPERNGGDSGDWNGSTSPRKEYSSSKDFSGRSGIDNWRRHRGSGEDEEGWRKSEKWGRSNSWRDEGDGGEGGGPKSTSRTSSWGRGWADEGIRGRRDDDDSGRRGFIDEVPEWAMENPSESGGSFDASGAFHGGNYSDEEEDIIGPRNSRNRLSDDPDSRTRSKSPPPVKKSIRHEYNDYDDEYEEPNNQSPKDRKLSRSQTAQGNLSESSSKPVPIPVSKSQSSSNIKSEPPENTVVSSAAKRTEYFDRIRVQHQNFVDKNSTNKEVSDSDELNGLNKNKKDVGDHNSVSENKLINSETKIVPEISRDKNSVLSKDNLNSNNNNNSAMKLPEEERDRGAPVNRQGSEEDMERMAEVVKDTVVKLFEDEEKPQVDSDKWYYRDPQGVVQGPFRSAEMLEWFMNGYFQLSLLVRRERDKVYVKLGELMQKCGKIPFLPGVNLPTIKPENEPPQPQQPQQPPPPPPTSVQPQPPNLTQSDLIMQQYHQYQLLQKQILLSQQLAINKLSQSEMWNSLSPAQQRNLLVQRLQVAQQQQQPQPTLEQFAQMEKNPLSQLIAQMQQQQQPAKVPMPDAGEIGSTNNVDPIRQLLQQMNLLQPAQPPVMPTMNPSNVVFNHHLAQQVHLQNSVLNNPVLNPAPSLKVEENKAEDPIQSLLRQLRNQSKVMMQSDQGDSLWGAPGRPQSWAQSAQPVATPPNVPLWEIKTEQQILAEQQLRLEEERKQEELRKLQEKEEAAKKQRELEEKRREEEKKEELKKLELKRLEEEKAKKLREKEEKKKAEELKKKQQEELMKKKQEEIKKIEEAQRKKEEKERKKEEERERKRLLEEEKKRIELEKRKKEEEALRKKQEEEEEVRRQEQHKRQMEALKILQEQQMKSRIAPWSQSNVTTGTSLADIQKLQEKEKKQLMREQQAIVQQMAHQNELQQMQREAESRSNGLNLKWVEQMPKMSQTVKSLAEIQAEEQRQLSKQQEKERLERLQQQRETSIPPTAGIWGAASQSLTWTNNNSPWGVALGQQNPSPGFWDEVAPVSSKNKTKTPSSPLKSKNQPPSSNQKQGTNSGANQKATKTKPKKDEVAVLKLFEPLGDEFTSWCSAALQSLQTEVDIPTFVTFLRDVDSPYEVKDYVKLYLGEGKDAQEFAKQFLERRSRWRSAQKANIGEDDMNAPAQAINPNSQYQNVAQEFQEVKGKKNKKGKMLKVDSRILGFSVTSAPDRINVGDRDYVDHNL